MNNKLGKKQWLFIILIIITLPLSLIVLIIYYIMKNNNLKGDAKIMTKNEIEGHNKNVQEENKIFYKKASVVIIVIAIVIVFVAIASSGAGSGSRSSTRYVKGIGNVDEEWNTAGHKCYKLWDGTVKCK